MCEKVKDDGIRKFKEFTHCIEHGMVLGAIDFPSRERGKERERETQRGETTSDQHIRNWARKIHYSRKKNTQKKVVKGAAELPCKILQPLTSFRGNSDKLC